MDTVRHAWGSGILAEGVVLSPFWEALHALSDLSIGLSYVAISATILYLLSRAPKLPFQWIFVAFGGFIVFCGIGHLMHVAVVANGANWPWLAGAQTLTVAASVATAVALPFQVPLILTLIEAARASEERRVLLEVAKAEAEAANHAKSAFLATMSHELRTPLTAILGFNELLRDDVIADTTARRDAFDDVERAAEHLLRLINDVLDVAKVEAGHMELEFRPVNLAESLAACAALVRERAADGGLALTLAFDPLPPVQVDERKVKQVIVNLLANAVKFTPAGGAVTLSARREGEYVAVAVADTGIGISAEDQRLLFQPFSQVDTSLTRRHEGTGLGLALAKQLVELHGGTLEVESVPGAGSTFTVRLPLSTPESLPETVHDARDAHIASASYSTAAAT